ncbi:MAG: hypothetical protein U0166_26980 [Acidobacteriota bacterium]
MGKGLLGATAVAALFSPGARAFDDDVAIVRVQSRHFDLYTDLDRRSAVAAAEELEAGYAVLWQVFFRAQQDPELRCLIYVIRDDRIWASIRAPQGGEDREEVRGFFDADPARPLFAASLSGAKSVPLRSTLHELAHLFIDQFLPYRPYWLNEGLAEYLATVEVDGGTVRFGKVPEDRSSVLATPAALLPPRDLMLLSKDDEASWSARRRDYLYAECWAWVHFLIHGKDGTLAPSIDGYLRALRAGDRELLADHLPDGTDLDALGTDFRFYVKRGLYRFRKVEGPLDVAPVVSATRLSPSDGLAALAYVMVRSGHAGAAVATMPREHGLPLGYLAAARIEARAGHLDRAARILDAGVAAHGDDPYLLLERARLHEDPGIAATVSDAAARRVADLDRIIETSPWLAAAINDRARAALLAGDVPIALSMARRAIALRGGEALYYHTLAAALDASGNAAGALEIETGALPLARDERLRKAMEEQAARLRGALAHAASE